MLAQNPKFTAIDKAIGKEGFKIILLLRLSPIFPFALSNYFYGVTAVGFAEYMAGTMLGFFPGTLAYVYGGMVSIRAAVCKALSRCNSKINALMNTVVPVQTPLSPGGLRWYACSQFRCDGGPFASRHNMIMLSKTSFSSSKAFGGK